MFSTENGSGQLVAGGNNEGSQAHELKNPRGIFVDEKFNLYIADQSNNRIQKWSAGATKGITVAGNEDGSSGNNLSCLHGPSSVILDRMGRIYVADTGNGRVVRWLPNATSGHCIVGCPPLKGLVHENMQKPTRLKFDSQGNLYVSDTTKRNFLKFSISHKALPSKLILF